MGLAIDVDPKRIAEFCRKWKIREFSLFGSVLCQDFGPDSDVDVLVSLADDADWSLYDWAEMIEELKVIFGRDVDLVEKSGLRNPFRRQAILTTKQVIYAA
jgi:predicted nucleotidyltransferase